MNKIKLYAGLTNGLLFEKVEYCIDVFDYLMEYSKDGDYLKVALPTARYTIGKLNIQPPIKELAETIISVYNMSYIMYTETVKGCDDVEAEATILMGKEIVKHYQ